jgi:hypothetical protein
MRGDLVVVPTFDLDATSAGRALRTEPKLAALYRDIALGSAPEELSLTELASVRPLLATFDPRWERSLARHLVPLGLSSIFEPEPRGASERKHALETFAPARDRLVRAFASKREPDLGRATATLLRARAIAMAACGDRDVLERSLDDLRVFAPGDLVGTTLERRTLTTKGPIDVRDLAP